MKRTVSRGRRTKDWEASSMTQFIDILPVFDVSRSLLGRGWGMVRKVAQELRDIL